MEAIDTNKVILFTEFMEQSQITVKEIIPLTIDKDDPWCWRMHYRITLFNKATNTELVVPDYSIGEGILLYWARELKPLPLPDYDPQNDFYSSERNQIKRKNSTRMAIKGQARRIKEHSRRTYEVQDKRAWYNKMWTKWIPEPIAILYCIISDVQSIEFEPRFIDWAKELGWDSIDDYEKARTAYDACCQEKVDLMRFLGSDYDTVFNNDHFEFDY